MISLTVAPNSNSKNWKLQEYSWDEIVKLLREPKRTFETTQEYKSFSKTQQSEIKDVGGYLAGKLVGKQRKASAVLDRSIVTLDIDYPNESFLTETAIKLKKYNYVIHSTHSHTPEKPKYRLLIPFRDSVDPVKYEAIARKIAEFLDFSQFDSTTFQPNRLMFWPSVPCDAEYIFKVNNGNFLDPNEILNLYLDWQDLQEWKFSDSETESVKEKAGKKSDPTKKPGLVGAFCRSYPIQILIDNFLKDIYEYHSVNRYSYKKGSTVGGVVVYDKGKFMYSFHSTDPLQGQLVNSFDVFCHYLHGGDTKQAIEAIRELEPVKLSLAEDRLKQAKKDFKDIENNLDWIEKLDIDNRGKYLSSAQNLNLIFEKDVNLAGKFAYNQFDAKRYVLGNLPWRKIEGVEIMRNEDYAGIRNYIECLYGISNASKVDDVLTLSVHKNSIHPLKSKLDSLKWDGKPRINEVLAQCFDVELNDYVEQVTAKFFIAAVKRVFEPGCKFDYVLTLIGEQGIKKSEFFSRIGMGYYSDSFMSVQGKESFEQLQGAWIIEIAELAALRRAEVEAVKHYITKKEDSYRPPYQRVIETFKRQCVFVGTTNNKTFLKDQTGNRRFWPVEVGKGKQTINDLTQETIEQLWAEAVFRYKHGEKIYLAEKYEEMAKEEQKKHAEYDPKTGIIENFLEIKLPNNWEDLDISMRQIYIAGKEKTGKKVRDRFCLLEIWCELFGKDKSQFNRTASYDLKNACDGLEDWEYTGKNKRFGIYGVQKCYKRKKARNEIGEISFDF